MTIRTNSEGEVTHTGGVTRITHGAPSPDTHSPLQADHESTKVGNQSFRMTGGQVQSTGVARYVVGQDKPVSIMATAQRSSAGLSVETRPGDPSSRTLIQSALRDGLVRRNSAGDYEDLRPQSALPAGEPGATAPEAEELAAEEQAFAYLDKAHLEEWNEMIEPISQPAYDGAVAAALSSITAGDGSMDKAVQRLVAETGMDPVQASELAETGSAMYRENLTRDLTSTGLISRAEAEPFYDWCREHRRLDEALSTFMLAGQTSVFRALAQEFAVKKQGGQL
jgi:hypothetical protein